MDNDGKMKRKSIGIHLPTKKERKSNRHLSKYMFVSLVAHKKINKMLLFLLFGWLMYLFM